MSVGTPHTARVALLWQSISDSQACENVFYLMDTSDAMFTDPGATIDAIWTAALDTVILHTDSNVSYTGVVFEDVRTVPFGGLEVPQTAVTGGASEGTNAKPSSMCKAIKKSTGTLGRSGRGRWFFPVLGSNVYPTADTLDHTAINAKVTALQSFQTALEAALSPAQMGIVSYRHGGVARTAGVFEQITAWGVVNYDVDVQRRRLVGHNRHR